MKHLLLTTIAAVLLVGCGPFMSIHEAAKAGNIKAVKQHLAAGADVNAKNDYGETPLRWSAWGGRKEIAELLISSVVVLGWIGLGKADEYKQTSERDDAAIHFFFNR